MNTHVTNVTSEMKIKFRDASANMSAGDIRQLTTFKGPSFTDPVRVCIEVAAKYEWISAPNSLCDPATILPAVTLRIIAANVKQQPEVLKGVQGECVMATTDFRTVNYTTNHYLTAHSLG